MGETNSVQQSKAYPTPAVKLDTGSSAARRERISTMLLQGILTRQANRTAVSVAREALKYADALITELDA